MVDADLDVVLLGLLVIVRLALLQRLSAYLLDFCLGSDLKPFQSASLSKKFLKNFVKFLSVFDQAVRSGNDVRQHRIVLFQLDGGGRLNSGV